MRLELHVIQRDCHLVFAKTDEVDGIPVYGTVEAVTVALKVIGAEDGLSVYPHAVPDGRIILSDLSPDAAKPFTLDAKFYLSLTPDQVGETPDLAR